MTKEEVFNKYWLNCHYYLTKSGYNPDEHFMRTVEECVGIPEQAVDDFRRQVFMKIGLSCGVCWADDRFLILGGKERHIDEQLEKACEMATKKLKGSK